MKGHSCKLRQALDFLGGDAQPLRQPDATSCACGFPPRLALQRPVTSNVDAVELPQDPPPSGDNSRNWDSYGASRAKPELSKHITINVELAAASYIPIF